MTENSTAVDMGLSKPQGCSQTFADADGDSWDEFQDKFLMYALATDLDRESGDVQIMMLLMCLDGDAWKYMQTSRMPQERVGKICIAY